MERAVSFSFCWLVVLCADAFSFIVPPPMCIVMEEAYIYILLVLEASRRQAYALLRCSPSMATGFVVPVQAALLCLLLVSPLDCLGSPRLNSVVESPVGRRSSSVSGKYLDFNGLTFETLAARQRRFNCKAGKLRCFNDRATASFLGPFQCFHGTVFATYVAAGTEVELLMLDLLSHLLCGWMQLMVFMASPFMNVAQAVVLLFLMFLQLSCWLYLYGCVVTMYSQVYVMVFVTVGALLVFAYMSVRAHSSYVLVCSV